MSDEYILDDVVETFSDEDTLMSDIRNNPVKWLLSLAIIGPGMAYTLTEQTSYATAMENWGLPTGLEWILAVFVTGQLFIAPLSCYFLARTGNVASGLFIAMGGSAILVANPDEIARFSEVFGWPFFLFCVALSVPMLMVLKNKKKLLTRHVLLSSFDQRFHKHINLLIHSLLLSGKCFEITTHCS